MTVAELIEKLKEMPQDSEIIIVPDNEMYNLGKRAKEYAQILRSIEGTLLGNISNKYTLPNYNGSPLLKKVWLNKDTKKVLFYSD